MDAFLHVHDADVSTLIKVRWCLRVVGAVYHLGGGARERERGGKWREEGNWRRRKERGGRRVR